MCARNSFALKTREESSSCKYGGDPPTQAHVQAVDDGLVAAITLLNETRAAVVEKGLIHGAA